MQVELRDIHKLFGTLQAEMKGRAAAAQKMGLTETGYAIYGLLSTKSRTLEAAEEAYRATNNAYASEADLYAAGLLTSESQLYDIQLVGDEFTLTPLAHCV